MKRTLRILICTIAAFMASAHAQPTDTLAKVKESGVLVIGARDTQPPFSYVPSGTGDPVGYSNDICLKIVEAVRKKLNMPTLQVRYQLMTSTTRIPLIQNGTADLDCASTTNSVVRQKEVDFAPSHFVTGITAAVPVESKIQTFADLEGKTVSLVAGSTSIQLLRQYQKNEKFDVKSLFAKDTSEGFLLMTTGRADAYILDDVQLAALIANSPNPKGYRLLKESLRTEPYGIMFRKNDPQFKDLVDQTVSGLMKSGEIETIYAKWFTQPIPPKSANLNFPMTEAIREIFRSPNNKGV